MNGPENAVLSGDSDGFPRRMHGTKLTGSSLIASAIATFRSVLQADLIRRDAEPDGWAWDAPGEVSLFDFLIFLFWRSCHGALCVHVLMQVLSCPGSVCV